MKIDLGYELSEHIVHPPLPPAEFAAALAKAECAGNQFLEEFYRACDGFELPDVHNGYFIRRAQKLSNRCPDSDIRSISGSNAVQHVISIGATGGGDRLVVDLDRNDVWFLPPRLIKDGVYYDDGAADRVATGAEQFVERVISDVSAFVRDLFGHNYIGSHGWRKG